MKSMSHLDSIRSHPQHVMNVVDIPPVQGKNHHTLPFLYIWQFDGLFLHVAIIPAWCLIELFEFPYILIIRLLVSHQLLGRQFLACD